jgi:alanine racemase
MDMAGRTTDTGRAWREIDRQALVHNARTLQAALAPGCRLMAVVKADAYGHGAVPTARCLAQAGVDAFAVACLAEGIALRRAGVAGQILILGYTPPEQAPLLARWRLTQAVADAAHGRALAARGVPLEVHLALDTGMHRLGIPAEDTRAIGAMYQLANLRITGVFSHLCVSDSLRPEDTAYTRAQLAAFARAVAWIRAQGYSPGQTHIQASYGIWNLPPQPCALARAGIALYGVSSSGADTRRQLDLRPVLALRARVASVRTLAAGEGAGYGLAFRAAGETRLAAVTIGYADGLPRALAQQGGQVLLHGVRCPMVGRLCMDQLLVDVTAVPQAAPGDRVTLIGADGGQVIRAEEVAARCGTITNELLARLSPRLPAVPVS